MRLYNTMTRRLDEFEAGPIVTLYVCGVTPYDTTHLGHAFSYLSFDVLVRFLRHLGHEVRYVENVTDIDDDILRKARQVGVGWDVLGREQTALFQRDMADLNALPPTHYPRATEHIPDMVAFIERLLANGHAYTVEGHAYFSAGSDPHFGELAGLTRQQMLERFEDTGDPPSDPRKRDPLDFILWKPSAPDEPSWPSPWGAGRPGWHIECSTMAMHFLGPRVDIHGGGDDLIFPHHSCEIAQSETATGERPFVRIWMHNGVARLDGIKMSKSLGNLVLVRKLLERFSADAIRIYLLQHQYRESFDYDEADLVRAAEMARMLAERVAEATLDAVATSDDARQAKSIEAAIAERRRRFTVAMADDLDTPSALLSLRLLAGIPGSLAAQTLRELGGVLGLRFDLA